MERTGKIIRMSIHTLLKDFHHYSTLPIILLLPFSASILLSQSLYQSIFQGKTISFLDIDLSQMIFSYVLSLPFALSSLAIAKASIIQSLNHQKPIFTIFCSSFVSNYYKPLALTYLCNIVLSLTIGTTTLFLLFEASSFFKGLSTAGLGFNDPVFNRAGKIILYVVLTNTMVLCNLALVVAGMDNCTAYKAIHKACLLRKGRNSLILLLVVPINIGLSAIEALFRYRVVRAYDHAFGKPTLSMVLEGLLIACLFSLVVVLDTICCCLFVKQAEKCYSQIDLDKQDNGIYDDHSLHRRLEDVP